MTVVLEATGTLFENGAASGSIDVSLPASIAANDVCLWHTEAKNTDSHTYPAGWTKVGEATLGTAPGIVHSWAWKRMAGGESGTVAVNTGTTTTDLRQSRITRYSGCVTSGNPYEAQATASDATTQIDPAAVTITGTDRLIVVLRAGSDDTAIVTTYSGGSNIGAITEHYEHPTVEGTDGSLALDFASPTGTGSVDMGIGDAFSGARNWIAFTIALQAAGGAPTQSALSPYESLITVSATDG